MKNVKLLTIPKLLMLIGSAWIIIFSLLYATKVITYNFYGWNENGATLIFLGLVYILIPFSVRPGLWTQLWALIITVISAIIVIGLFVGNGSSTPNYKDAWTYISALPHMLMALGSLLWIFNPK